jgi:RNA polymerase sigma-70 factor (ECF subfamily)
MGLPDAEDVLQEVRAKLLLGEEGRRPRIEQYAGTGSLEGWVRVAAVRQALSLRRSQKRRKTRDDELLIADVTDQAQEPEVDFFARRYKTDFEAAIREALESLGPEPRTLLRMHVIDGLSIDDIGALHDVHRATAARWIKRIREELLRDARERFIARHDLTPSECDSLVAKLRSNLHVSVDRLLRGDK